MHCAVRQIAIACLVLACLFASCRTDKRPADLSKAPRIGKEGAPIEVVVFADFQCIFCKRAALELKRIYLSKPNRIRIYFKHFPLSRHPFAFNAARAAEAARLQGRFWEMHDLLFARAESLDDSVWPKLAAEAGLDVPRFLEDIWSAAVRDRVIADKSDGIALGVKGTPYFLINGMPFRYSYADLAKRLKGLDGFR